MQNLLTRFIIAVQLSSLLCVWQPAIVSASTQINTIQPAPQGNISFSYGTSGTINYDQKTGTFSVIENGKTVLGNCYSKAGINGKLITSTAYKSVAYTKTLITDGFGKGVKHTFTLNGNNLPNMVQVFYTYPSHKGYFFIELYVKGKNLKTNYMEPIAGNMAAISDDTRSVFVPFDNDTFISYDSKAFKAPLTNTSAEVGTVFDNSSRMGLVVGSVEHETWKTGVPYHRQKRSCQHF
ncbi:hypothetical protein ACFJIV_18965 [Mucilaginibacter sp. UC70_90]